MYSTVYRILRSLTMSVCPTSILFSVSVAEARLTTFVLSIVLLYFCRSFRLLTTIYTVADMFIYTDFGCKDTTMRLIMQVFDELN